MEGFWSNFCNGAGKPRLEGAPSTGKRDSMPASDAVGVAEKPECTDEQTQGPAEAKISTLQVDGIFGLRSPDQQALPTRTITWEGQESFTPTDEPSCFFPADPCSDSSSSCAGDQEIENDEPVLPSMPCPVDTGGTGGVGEGSRSCKGGVDLPLANSAPLTPLNPSGMAADVESSSVQGNIVTTLTGEQQHLSPATGAIDAMETVIEPPADVAVVGRMPQWITGRKVYVVLLTLATFVVGMFVGDRDHGAVTTERFSSNAMTLYAQPKIVHTTEAPVSGVGVRQKGRTAAASASAPVGTLASPGSDSSSADAVKRANKLDFQVRVMGRMRKAREVINEVQDAWAGVTAIEAFEAPYPGLLDGPGPGAPGLPGPPPTVSQPDGGWFGRSPGCLTCNYRSSFEAAINGHWV